MYMMVEFFLLFLDGNSDKYFLLNSSLLIKQGISSITGLRFSITSLKVKIALQSLTGNPIQLRYKIRISTNQNKNSRK